MAVKMVPTMSVVIVRDGKRVKPEIGKSFDFTADERDSILEAQPNALRKAAAGDEEGTADTSSAEQSQAKAKGGKKKATAAKSDAEAAADGDGGEPEDGEGGGAGAGTDDDL